MNFEIIEKRCLRACSFFCKVVGMWPGQDSYIQYVASAVLYPAMLFSIVTQTSRIVVYWSIDTLLEQLLYLCVPIGMWVKYSCFVINQAKFKVMYESILADWLSTKTEDEQKIVDRFADNTIFFIRIYVVNAYFLLLSFLFVPFVPIAMDVVLPLNESRPRVHMYEGYYFVKNEADYYYTILIYTIVTVLMTAFTFIAADTILIYLVQHSCSLLSIAGHRIRFALEDWLTSQEVTAKDRKKMYDSLVCAIQSHQRALAFVIDLDKKFRIALFLEMVLVVMTLTTSLLKAASVKLSTDTYQFYAYSLAQLVHMFFLTAQGQFIINEHDTIYRKGFEMAWHKVDPKTQALLILIQRRNLNPPLLTAGGLIQLDFDSFSEVIKASVSYFTVLKSI